MSPSPRTSPSPSEPPAQTPSPSQSPSQSPPSSGAPARSPSSGTGSSADFIADAGPVFDPRHAPAPPAVDELDEPDGQIGWEEEQIRDGLELAGETLHWLFNGGPDDEETWLMTQRDLRAMVKPSTRILNRYDVTRAAAAAGDEALLAAALIRYGTRNYTKRRRYLKLAAQQGPRPVTGVPAPEGTGPADDLDWQRVHDPGELGDQELPVVDGVLDDSPPDLPPRGGRR